VIFHFNDIHGYIAARRGPDGVSCGGLALLASALAEGRRGALWRNARSILLFAGDMFSGTPVVEATRGECMISLFNDLRVTAACLGNHEFDYGPEVLARRLSEARFPILATNVSTSLTIGSRLGRLALLPAGPLRIGLIGATTPQTRSVSFPAHVKDFRFDEPADVLPGAVRRLREAGAHVVVALTHDGLEHDRQLAARVAGIDLIVGGHSHTAIEEVVTVGRTAIVQAGQYGQYLGEVRLSVDPVAATGRCVFYRLHALCSPPLVPDPGVESKVVRFEEPVRRQMERVVGELAIDVPQGLRGDYSPAAGLMAAAMLAAHPSDIALMNSGGVRRGLDRGPISAGTLQELSPFGNTMVTMRLTGSSILRMLERSASGAWKVLDRITGADSGRRLAGRRVIGAVVPGPGAAGFLVPAGMTWTFDPRLPPGSRVTGVQVGGRPLDPAAGYSVVTNNYLASGGDGHVELTSGAGVRHHGERDRDVLEAYLVRHRPLAAYPAPTVVNRANRIEPPLDRPAGPL
jgi:2',3'-cyclic-nucleotide 2'-phosphodiesterase (5'-nucleotidase family)